MSNRLLNIKADIMDCLMSDYPIIFNSQIPHRVVVGKNATFPRILISIIPIKDPVHFLGH